MKLGGSLGNVRKIEVKLSVYDPAFLPVACGKHKTGV
jgi:hypothetical protein